jgi:hypothetical protein
MLILRVCTGVVRGQGAGADCELLAKSQVLQQQASASAEDVRECPEPESEQVNHDGKVTTDGILVPASMFLISRPDGIVANAVFAQDELVAKNSRKSCCLQRILGLPSVKEIWYK